MSKVLILNEKHEQIPNNWKECKLDDVSILIRGITFPKGSKINKKKEGYIPCLRTTNVQEKIDWTDLWFVPKDYVKRNEQYLQLNDILISTANSLELVGKVSPVTELHFKSTLGAFITCIRCFSPLNPKFLYYQLYSQKSREYFRTVASTTVNISNVSTTKLSNLPLIIPPLNEQNRIVLKIEELFSILDAGKNVLIKTKLQLTQYKHSLLKKAFIGELTMEHRIKNRDDSILPLLKKIELNKSKQEKKLKKLPVPENTDSFHQIPNVWKWVRVGNVCLRLQYGTSEKAHVRSNGIPVLRMGNIVEGEIDFTNLKYYPKNWKKRDEFLLEPGDILFNRTNSSELVGKTAEYKSDHPEAVFASYLIRAIIDSEILKPSLLSYYVNSVFGRMFIKSVVSQQVGQANVNGTKFSLMLIPLIPMNEQKALVDKIEFGMSVIHKIKDEVDAQLINLFRMKHSILNQAFEGKLVPQYPYDEPAEILLEKIKQEKEKIIKAKPKPMRKKNDK